MGALGNMGSVALPSSSLVPRDGKQLACEHTFDMKTNQQEPVTSNHLYYKFLHTKQVVSP